MKIHQTRKIQKRVKLQRASLNSLLQENSRVTLTKLVLLLKWHGKKEQKRRVIHLTESRWPNEYDRNRWTEISKIHMLMFVVVIIFILFSIFGQIHSFFGHVQRLMFVVVKFRSSSDVNVHHCQFFGQILTNFWSSWFSQVN